MAIDEKRTPSGEFSEEEKQGLYRAIYERRDIRGQFTSRPIPEKTLASILQAAHHAPSVGYMQPWNFIVIKDRKTRERIKAGFERANTEAAAMFPEGKRKLYTKLKLEGILESPVNICITCDRNRFGPVVIGRTANIEMDLFSSVCAVQNLWLAARAEGLGVGWVSIIHNSDISEVLQLPEHVVPIAYLCIGYVTHFPKRPELEAVGWLPRLPLKELVFFDGWGKESADWPELEEEMKRVSAVEIK